MNNHRIHESGQQNSGMKITSKLSLLWLLVMLNMIYADILAFVSAFITPGTIDALMDGYSGTVKLSQQLLLISAVLIEIPILMIFLCQWLTGSLNRWLNIFASVITVVFVVGGLETEPFFLFLAAIEILTLFGIFYLAVRWKCPLSANENSK